ncbi:MAG: hypothetical protein ACT4P1_02115 [Sporichthyaceae bacterium]
MGGRCRTFGVCAILGVGFAHASLLLHVVRRAAPAARAICGATVVAVAVVATMLAALVALTESGGGEGFWRIIGVVAIVDVVGSVVTPLVARLQRPAEQAPAPVGLRLRLSSPHLGWRFTRITGYAPVEGRQR